MARSAKARLSNKPRRRGRSASSTGARRVVRSSAVRATAQARPAQASMVRISEKALSDLQMALRGKLVKARYDAAQTTDENRRHWMAADPFGPDKSNSPSVRKTLRERARLECANNCYAAGAVQSLANDIVGTGPRLLVQWANRDEARRIEQAFARWARAARLATKLQVMVKARVRDGEAFGVLINNPELRSEVMLDVKLIEADMVCAPMGRQDGPLFVDGIEYDSAWNPVRYWILDQHPGEALSQPVSRPFDAASVLHTYREDRPGQSRGIPELTPALPMFALLRQFILATIRAADHAADYAAVMHTTMAEIEAAEVVADGTMEIERGSMTALPEGWTITQLDAKHPNSTFKEFIGQTLDEVGRALQMPSNIIRGNSAGYNYSSGRLDHQVYRRNIAVYRQDIERAVLDELLAAWFREAALIPGMVPAGMRDMLEMPHSWMWPGFFHVDPNKEADAQAQRLQNATTTLQKECEQMEVPQHWEENLEQRALELKRMRELGIPLQNEFGVPVENKAKQDPSQAEDAAQEAATNEQ